MSFVKTVSLLLTAIPSISSGAVLAADYKLDPFTLTHDGAITKNMKGKVNIHPVTYKLYGFNQSTLTDDGGEQSRFPVNHEKCFTGSTSAKSKELFMIDGATHIETYRDRIM